MSIASPIFFLLCLLPGAYVVWSARRISNRFAARMLQITTLFLCLSAGDFSVQCSRALDVVVLIDVSASTRAATFRDDKSWRQRLGPLLAGRSFRVNYFADDLQPDTIERTPTRTQFPLINADAIMLFSDGQFELPRTLMPGIFPVIDPAMNEPADAQVAGIVAINESTTHATAHIQTRVSGPDRTLMLHNAQPASTPLNNGPRVIVAYVEQNRITALLNPSDPWPENDTMSLEMPADNQASRWSIGRTIAGLIEVDAPNRMADYLSAGVVVVDTQAALSTVQQTRLLQYARDTGGTVVLLGSPMHLSGALRNAAAIGPAPPKPDKRFIFLIDASGSMSTQQRWPAALQAVERAMQQLPDAARVQVGLFSQQIDWTIPGTSAVDARAQVSRLSRINPSGPTGLQLAIDALDADAFAGANVYLITDAQATLSDVDARAASLARRSTRVSAVLVGADASPALLELSTRTGGSFVVANAIENLPAALTTQINAALAATAVPGEWNLAPTGELAGLRAVSRGYFKGYTRTDARVLARVDSSSAGVAGGLTDDPLIAVRPLGLGRIFSVAADVPDDFAAAVAERVTTLTTDPRFSVIWNDDADEVRVRAVDYTNTNHTSNTASPINGLIIELMQSSVEAPVLLAQIAPGEYSAPVQRLTESSLLTIRHEHHIIARRALAGRYAKEFDYIGNNMPVLRALASQTGGRVILPGDNTPIDFPQRFQNHRTRPWFIGLSIVFLFPGTISIIAPYLHRKIARPLSRYIAKGLK
jgi:hypothetical protein